MKPTIEILSPAGSYDSLIAAISAGADAVYIGGTRFGARAYADNLDEDKMLEAIDFVHLHGKKIYMTINTLLKDSELKEELYDYLLPYYKRGLDAVIVQDFGVLQFVRQCFPDLPIHASTQMTVTNVLSAQFLERQGVERVVTSREMNLEEIREIAQETNLEIESFVHGALCYCYSGQCLYSSLLGGRSGNRGQCAQPCRLPYRLKGSKSNQYLLSLKDICTLELIPELVEAGIHSFKIEGRMKKPEYVALVTAMYRKYVDLYFKHGKEKFCVDSADKEKLMDLYNRGGFHEGYYHTRNGREMISIERPNHAGVPAFRVVRATDKNICLQALTQLHKGDVIEFADSKDTLTMTCDLKKGKEMTVSTRNRKGIRPGMFLNRTRNESLVQEIKETIINNKPRQSVNGKLILSLYAPAKFILQCQGVEVTVYGAKAMEAINQPMDRERIDKQMKKTGNTEFVFDNLAIQMQEELFIPIQELNDLRRKGLDKLKEKILTSYCRQTSSKWVRQDELSYSRSVEGFFVYVEELEQFEEVLSHDCVKRVYLDANAIPNIWLGDTADRVIQKAKAACKEIYLALPHILRQDTIELYERQMGFLTDFDWDGMLIRNVESFEFLKRHQYDKEIVLDYSLYHFNQCAKVFWQQQGIKTFTAPLELNYKELKEVGLSNGELVVYGYLPMMVSAQCVTKTIHGCQKTKGRQSFIDRYQKEFVVKNHCDYCYNVIYNTAPLMLLDQTEEIQELAPYALRLQFTTERKSRVREILQNYEEVFMNKKQMVPKGDEFTRGHFKRGIK